eukprot:6963418-Prymnesium_polylepis.1
MARRGQAPGGNSSFTFDDGWGGGGLRGMQEPARRPLNLARDPNVHVITEKEGESAHRHTNGLRRQGGGEYKQPPGGFTNNIFGAPTHDGPPPPRDPASLGQFKQPPGGHSSISFGQDDSLSNFVNSQPKVAASRNSEVAQPPGGYSSFSLGWGDDSKHNHHHDFQSRRRPMSYPSADGGMGGGMGGNGGMSDILGGGMG